MRRRLFGPSVTLLSIFALTAATADQSLILLDRARRKVNDNLDRAPRYTCVQSITRRAFIPKLGSPPARGCGYVAHYSADNPKATSRLDWLDLLRFDAAVSEGREIYSWAGAKTFSTEDKHELVGDGAMSTGDFGGFLTTIFHFGLANFTYVGEHTEGSQKLAEYHYRVPTDKSQYQLRTQSGQVTIGFEGVVLLDSQTADLKLLTVVSHDRPAGSQLCAVSNRIDYQQLVIGKTSFLLPKQTRLTLLDEFGDQSDNETTYTSCREYHGESTIHFEDYPAAQSSTHAAQPAEIPPKMNLDIRLNTAIDSRTMMAGDAVEGFITKPLKAKDGRVVIPRSAVFRGRIVRMREHFLPVRAFVIGIRFDSVEIGGVTTPLTLIAITDGSGVTMQARRAHEAMGLRTYLPGVESTHSEVARYVFPGGDRPTVKPGFITHWTTAAPPAGGQRSESRSQ